MPTKKDAASPPRKSARKAAGFTAEEKAAMKARSQELKAEGRRAGRATKDDGEADLLAAIAAMAAPDRAIGERLHALITETAPELSPKTWYGMPAWAKDGKVVCYFRNATKFKERYAMLGFNDGAKLDDGAMWPVAFALTELTATDEARIRALVTKALG